ncbi:hypothetical protein OG936_21920 [Streptomyces sp. NBC_00846]|uniref:hypothetical protein n=1 Tax=Streptomyces sp. NBC_00846 TaxID=2975849 RepID=UPI003868C4DC|nr:hypothetical protein OG936_21920 [Streptomyces sp. NBC_00846]
MDVQVLQFPTLADAVGAVAPAVASIAAVIERMESVRFMVPLGLEKLRHDWVEFNRSIPGEFDEDVPCWAGRSAS